MNGKVPMTVSGNLVADPELRITPSGVSVTNFTVASNPRVFNQQSGQWEDGAPLFMRCRVWREQAENVAESNLHKGMRVVVTGVLTQRSWEDEDKQKHTVYELDAEDVAVSMKFARTTVKRITREQDSGNSTNQQNSDTHKRSVAAGAGKWQDENPPF